MERRVLWATVHRVTKSRTWLKWQHSHMHIMFNTGITAASYLHQNGPLLEARRKENADDSQCLWLFWWIRQKQVACICPLVGCGSSHQSDDDQLSWSDCFPSSPFLCYLFTGARASHCVPEAWSPPPPHTACFTQLPLPRPSPISCLQQVSKLWFFQYSCMDVRVGL